MLTNTVSNFINFAPVGTVLIAILGIGLAEHSGLLGALLQRVVRVAKGSALTASIVFAGVLSSLGADSGYVVLVPLAGLAFASAGRHPLAGIAAATGVRLNQVPATPARLREAILQAGEKR